MIITPTKGRFELAMPHSTQYYTDLFSATKKRYETREFGKSAKKDDHMAAEKVKIRNQPSFEIESVRRLGNMARRCFGRCALQQNAGTDDDKEQLVARNESRASKLQSGDVDKLAVTGKRATWTA